jgi:hypothetical protein
MRAGVAELRYIADELLVAVAILEAWSRDLDGQTDADLARKARVEIVIRDMRARADELRAEVKSRLAAPRGDLQ